MTAYLTRLNEVAGLDSPDLAEMEKVEEKYPFRVNSYYLSLIDWNDQDDPIRRLVFPSEEESAPWGRLDPSDESHYTVIPGLEHKYHSTALLLVSDVCAGICRFCFRKRFFQREKERC